VGPAADGEQITILQRPVDGVFHQLYWFEIAGAKPRSGQIQHVVCEEAAGREQDDSGRLGRAIDDPGDNRFLLFIGAFIEIYQLFFVPGRSFSLKDFLADCIGILVYFIVDFIVKSRRKKRKIFKIENLKYKTLVSN